MSVQGELTVLTYYMLEKVKVGNILTATKPKNFCQDYVDLEKEEFQ